jgi:hypothetical protein
MPSAKHTPDCSQRYLSLGHQIWYIPDPHLSSSFISAIPHTHLPNKFSIATTLDPLDLWALNRISLEQIYLDYFGLIGLLIFSLTTDVSRQLIGLVCKLYYPPFAYLFASNKNQLVLPLPIFHQARQPARIATNGLWHQSPYW